MSENTAPQDALYGLMDMFSDMVAEKLEQRIKAAQPEPLQDNTAFTTQEAAEYLGVCRASVYRAVQRGEIPHYRPAKNKILIHKRELDKWIANGGSA